MQVFLGLITIGPWLVLVVYDVLLYIFRSVVHEVPVVGGRSRGSQRPRAPSLTARPSGRPRSFSFGIGSGSGTDATTDAGLRDRIRRDAVGEVPEEVFKTD